MRPPLKFFVAGLPAGQPRVKARFTGKFTQIYTPTTVKGPLGTAPHPAATWKMIVRAEAEKAWHAMDYPNQWTGPLCVNLTFYFQRPQAHFRANGRLKPNAPKWHTSKPDRDNCDKLVLDALTNLCLWGDDCQVCDGRPCKLYAGPGQQSGCLIEIKEAQDAPPVWTILNFSRRSLIATPRRVPAASVHCSNDHGAAGFDLKIK